MSLVVLMYHRARAERHGNAPEMLDRHFAEIAGSHRCVLPGEPLAGDRLNVCLTFDDGYFDFYAVVFPLLEKHRLRAVLAIPPSVVRERADVPAAARLSAPACMNEALPNDGAFCTWPEIREMADSERVSIAAHGFTHQALDNDGADLHSETVVPQTLLSARLGRPVDSFVARFLGEWNLVPGRVTQIESGKATLAVNGGASIEGSASEGLKMGAAASALIRPEHVRPVAGGRPARISERIFLGEIVALRLALPGGTELWSRLFSADAPASDQIEIGWDREKVSILPETG